MPSTGIIDSLTEESKLELSMVESTCCFLALFIYLKVRVMGWGTHMTEKETERGKERMNFPSSDSQGS